VAASTPPSDERIAMSIEHLPAALEQLTPGRWSVDPAHSKVGFVARHMMVTKVHGSFDDYTAEIVVADDPTQSTLNVEVQMASVSTGDETRDNHLRTNDFFDIEKHPTMTLRATGFDRKRDHFVMHTELTIKGITKPVDFDLEFGGVGEDPWGGTRAGFEATATVNRKDWGIEWNAPLETGGFLVGDRVTIELDIELVQEQPSS
jgi:polyisoprenoid-binding protein YceI